MTDRVSHEELMRYLDGEATPDERAKIDRALDKSTELQREVALYHKMKEDLQTLHFGSTGRRSVWFSVNRKLTRPVGWAFLIGGFSLWLGYGSYLYMVSAIEPIEKLATSGIVLGVLFLLGSVIYDRWRELPHDPYRDVTR